MVATTGTLNGEYCYIVGVRNGGYISLKYLRMSDGALLQQSPDMHVANRYQNVQY